jgi:hypothetical protein
MDENPDTTETRQAPQDVVPAPRREIRHFKAVNIIYYVVGVVEVILAFRFVLHLLAANPASGFVMFIDSVSAPFIAPFNMIFPTSVVGSSAFEWPVLLAMVIYLIVAFGIVQLINVFVARAPQEEM